MKIEAINRSVLKLDDNRMSIDAKLLEVQGQMSMDKGIRYSRLGGLIMTPSGKTSF
jgi:hypothetical protein